MTCPSKIIVIGDIRGDSEVLLKSLELANVIENGIWIGKDTHVIQMGNTLSGKTPKSPLLCKSYKTAADEIKICNLINLFDSQAKIYNGRLISILGKQEMLSYYYGNDSNFMNQYVKKTDEIMYKKIFNCSRKKFWEPGKEGGKILSKRPLFYTHGKFLFTNANSNFISNCKDYNDYNEINDHISKWFRKENKIPEIFKKSSNNPLFIHSGYEYDIINLPGSMKWVVSGNVLNKFNNLIKIKQDSSRAFGDNCVSVEILEIIQDEMNVTVKRISQQPGITTVTNVEL